MRSICCSKLNQSMSAAVLRLFCRFAAVCGCCGLRFAVSWRFDNGLDLLKTSLKKMHYFLYFSRCCRKYCILVYISFLKYIFNFDQMMKIYFFIIFFKILLFKWNSLINLFQKSTSIETSSIKINNLIDVSAKFLDVLKIFFKFLFWILKTFWYCLN